MLQTRHAPAAETLALAPGVALARARAHEATGPARALLALLVGATAAGPILWLRPGWHRERLNGDGVAALLDPGRLVFAQARTPPEILWAAEEGLRTGLAPLVVAEMPAPPGLTAVRRLHLAAEAGAGRAAAPLMLLLTPGAGGAAGIETRWHLAPIPGWACGGAPRWRLTRLRARAAPEQAWDMRLDRGRVRITAPADAATAAIETEAP